MEFRFLITNNLVVYSFFKICTEHDNITEIDRDFAKFKFEISFGRICYIIRDPRVLNPGLTLVPAWIRIHIHYRMWDEIIFPFPNFNGSAVEVWEWIKYFIPHFIGHVITYLCCNLRETFSALLSVCAGNSVKFPAQRPVTRSFDVFFDLRLNERLSKQW